MRRAAGEQRAGRRVDESLLQVLGRLQTEQTEPHHEQRVSRDAHRPQDVIEELTVTFDEGLHERHPALTIATDRLRHL